MRVFSKHISIASCIRACAPHKRIHRSDHGFVLPVVLVSIAGIALLATAAFAVVTRSANTMRALDNTAQEDFLLLSAEAQATFYFLTSLPIRQGLWMTPPVNNPNNAPNAAGALIDVNARPEPETLQPEEYWPATGGTRITRSAGRTATVRYRDAAGLFPLGTTEEEDVEDFLTIMGMDRNKAQNMTARLLDYQDFDNVRRFQGAERADYRLFSRPPPTNSPLRTTTEAARVLGMFDAAPALFWQDLLEFATVEQNTFLRYAAPQKLAPLFAQQFNEDDPVAEIFANANFPSDRARFLLEIRSENRTRKRAIDIKRPQVVSQEPYQRFWIYEKTEQRAAPSTDVSESAQITFPNAQRGSQ